MNFMQVITSPALGSTAPLLLGACACATSQLSWSWLALCNTLCIPAVARGPPRVEPIPHPWLRYTTYIPWLFMIIYGIYFVVYIMYIQCICLVYILNILGIYIWYVLNILCIYMVCTLYIHSIIHVYSPPGGWCCGGGQGPIPPAPPATTSESPGRAITFILLEQGIECHTRNIPWIYQVYSRYIPNACPWTSCSIRLQGWPRGYL